ncbi:SCAP [Drosophila busckii]|uniref:Sterol regulatory element-binding protein cleavage-activating protein n=1 Tax=Drosophila busckii TaxID=30019 RepID=A0A0M5J9X3_DROBS|nr:sterol regulatory element-binding protein cleavage-activating protein [Drosophila busckii]ALC41168.1 SCAP [Drosophila busckii]
MAAATDGSAKNAAAAAAASSTSTSLPLTTNGSSLTGKAPKYNMNLSAAATTPKTTTAAAAAAAATTSSSSSTTASAGLPASVAHFYYKHGLFLSSYPTCATSIALMAILLSCYPLINIPLPGTIPTKIVLPYTPIFNEAAAEYNQSAANAGAYNGSSSSSSSGRGSLPWAPSSPALYVQQITLRASVQPWNDEMQLMDAFRAPLYEVFKLIEIVRNHQSSENQRTLEQSCLHVDNVKRGAQGQLEQIFPEYGCLLLSPANLWAQNSQNFSRDTNILNTIFQYHNLQKSKVSTAEMLFGLPMQDTGFKRYPLRARSRIIQYALTLVLTKNDAEYLATLKEKLLRYYPPLKVEAEPELEPATITYIFYPDEYKIWEFLPLSVAFVLVFVYVYFSVRKIDVFRSRVLLALCSVFTTLGSLAMSLGLCFFFGLTISLQSKDIFPYLVILVGLENSLVITKCVVSMDETFDVKIRVAQALSKEGWHISKTLLTEITILTIGLATFVPVIQEFCIFAIVGLMSDFMLQMLLFSTILAMNIKRAEYTTEAKHLPKMMLSCTLGNGSPGGLLQRQDFRFFGATPPPTYIPGGFQRSQSHPKLCFAESVGERNALLNGHAAHGGASEPRIPKRIKIVNFWARTRFFQRAFMIWMSVWICSIVYNSGYLEQLFSMRGNATLSSAYELQRHLQATRGAVSSFLQGFKPTGEPLASSSTPSFLATEQAANFNETAEELLRLRYPNFELNYFLSNFHWSTIMKQYNVSLSGQYVTLLPTIRLTHVITPELATLLRNAQEQLRQNFQWKALAAALDPLDFNDDDPRRESPMVMSGGVPLVPKSPMEIFLAILLCCISIFVLCYTMVVFYRCICTRNYAEWRSSWHESEAPHTQTEHILEGVTTRIAGHKHRIECLASDGNYIISCCLKGQIRVWDARNGEQLASIARRDMQIAQPRPDGHTLLRKLPSSPVWCLDYFDNLIAVGCANGRVELWESPAGVLKCAYQEDAKRNQGITHIHLNGDRVIVARLNGRLDFYRLETYYKGRQIDWGFTSAYRRTHVRTGSTGSLGLMMPHQQHQFAAPQTKEEMKITLEGVRLAHQQPITCMQVVNDMVFTGSQDHTLKVYCLNKSDVEYTLHGHCGPITCLFVDRWQPGTGGSGSQDGLLCVWDLFTGACLYNIQAHDGAISCLACAPSYVISLGTDERICVWERFQGNLLTTINISNAYSSLLMLTPSLLVTSRMGSLIVWDVRTGQPAREVKLDLANLQLCPKSMMLAGDSVVCDYGNEIRVVRFPIVADKCH